VDRITRPPCPTLPDPLRTELGEYLVVKRIDIHPGHIEGEPQLVRAGAGRGGWQAIVPPFDRRLVEPRLLPVRAARARDDQASDLRPSPLEEPFGVGSERGVEGS
jgi:hypothetical protein